jgi:hypothetical protein
MPADAKTLEQRALEWVAPYAQAEHLIRTRDWLLELEPDAGEALVLAALTHDIERFFPDGPRQDKAGKPWDDPGYLAAHSERSAKIVRRWLREQGASPELVDKVDRLIRAHELGGSCEADLLQAADSISFLESLCDVVVSWVREGVCDAAKAKEKLDWMFDRIRVERARGLARPFYEQAIAALDHETAVRNEPFGAAASRAKARLW